MRASGTGYPMWFHCPVWRDENNNHHLSPNHYPAPRRHNVTLTGRTKRPPSPNKGNPRKSTLSREYVCECGHRGWSCHKDLERLERKPPS